MSDMSLRVAREIMLPNVRKQTRVKYDQKIPGESGRGLPNMGPSSPQELCGPHLRNKLFVFVAKAEKKSVNLHQRAQLKNKSFQSQSKSEVKKENKQRKIPTKKTRSMRSARCRTASSRWSTRAPNVVKKGATKRPKRRPATRNEATNIPLFAPPPQFTFSAHFLGRASNPAAPHLHTHTRPRWRARALESR